MKVKLKKSKTLQFYMLGEGECFLITECGTDKESVFMKIRDIDTEGGVSINAVRLNDGFPHVISKEREIKSIKCELTEI